MVTMEFTAGAHVRQETSADAVDQEDPIVGLKGVN